MPDKKLLWEEFIVFVSIPPLEKVPICGLCGNTGRIDTRGRAKTATGIDCGVLGYCICPNGRAMKK